MGFEHLLINTEETKILKWFLTKEEAQLAADTFPPHIQYRNVYDISFSYFTKPVR